MPKIKRRFIMNWKGKLFFLAAFLLLAIGATLLFVMTGQDKPPIVKTKIVMLEVQSAPDFTLTATPDIIYTFPDRSVAYSLTVTSVNKFVGEINFSIVEQLPAGIQVTWFPANKVTLGEGETKGIQANVAIGTGQALVGSYQITFRAESTIYN